MYIYKNTYTQHDYAIREWGNKVMHTNKLELPADAAQFAGATNVERESCEDKTWSEGRGQ